MSVTHVVAGAVTDGGATVAAKLTAGADVRLRVSAAADLSDPLFSAAAAPDQGYIKRPITGLAPRTDYHYGLEVDGALDAIRGRFRTFPIPGVPADHAIAFGSCWRAVENHKGALKIAARDVDLFLQLGDNGYNDEFTNNFNTFASATDETPYRTAWDAVLATVNISDLAKRHAWAYVWDDHDYGNNNSNGSFFCKPAASTTYRRMWPHYPLPAGDGNNPIYQAFSIGRVRYIMTDLRHQRSASTMDSQPPGTSLLGATQRAWFEQELIDAAERDDALIVWCSSNVLLADKAHQPGAYTADDSWAEAVVERQELFDLMKALGLRGKVCVLSGDQHALSIDGGRHCDYATGGGMPIPIFIAAPLGRTGGNLKGGPYDYESYIGAANSNYGIHKVRDDGDRVVVTWEAWTVVDATGVETLKYRHRFAAGRRYLPRLSGRPVLVDGALRTVKPR